MNMLLPKATIKCIHYFLVFCLCLTLFGCTSGSISNIQNIRQNENVNKSFDIKNLTIMTFNIRAGGGVKNPGMSPRRVKATEENLFKIANAINSAVPDIIGLQEVRGYNQAKFIAEKLNMNFAYSVHGRSNWWGLAVLSKFSIKDISAKLINYRSDNRIALMAMIDINGKTINVLNVHYALENYYGQAKATMEFSDKAEGPIILLGDLNRQPFDSELKPIQDKMTDTCLAVETDSSKKAKGIGTVGGFKWQKSFAGGKRIDYIFVDSQNFKVTDAGLLTDDYYNVSDHRAYWSKIRFKD